MTVEQVHPFQRTTEDWWNLVGVIANEKLREELDKTKKTMEQSNRSLLIWLKNIGDMVVEQEIIRGNVDMAEELRDGYVDGALISYHTLIPPNDTHALPRLTGTEISRTMRDAPRAADPEHVWHFAIEGDFILKSMLNLGMTALGHSELVRPAAYNGAGLVNHLFNDTMARSN